MTLPRTDLFIDGDWCPATGEPVDDIVNPATEGLLATVRRGSAEDCDAAMRAARRAFDEGPWPNMSGAERGRCLEQFHAALASRIDSLTDLVVAEVGTTRAAAASHQVGLPIEQLEYWATAARRPELVAHPPRVTPRSSGTSWLGSWIVRREPAGVVAAITAYNFPFLLNVMKLGPALAAGNTVVLKPSPFTPLTAFVIAEAAADAALPPGVVNVVTGDETVGRQLSTSPLVDLVTFTGSDQVGAAIAAQAAPTLKRVLLELGGKSALIIRADADLDLAAQQGVQSFTFNAGQGCALTTRHLVHHSVLGEYHERVAALLQSFRVGDPADPKTQMGPLIRPVAVDRTERYVKGALHDGASLVSGGARPAEPSEGYFFEPTMLGDVVNEWPVAQDEIFGPVAVTIGFVDDDEAVALANHSRYGLDAAIISRDAGAAFALACRLRTGGVALNGGSGWTNPGVPFGGYKRSGLGRENGDAGLDEYTELKTIKFHAA
ncbi:MAG TPA: aldehyde dehydrogenase family protein [Acidimicrobiia bacterium]|nr:aldehyde dehydrogenase family protein [Acidimicrobiia bacterium]